MDEEKAGFSQSDEDACGKLWEIYVNEAKQYDESLIKSWKDDMDNTLVFSGLYSAILTAFVIESYQNLQPDPAEISTSLLKRISEQLASSPDAGSLTPFPDEAAFKPDTSALICNILWFISLALALSCAFLATLVQQWSRKFLHRTTMVRSAGARAHLIQFLYFGLKRLGMHTIVDVIPSLLHLSLFAFFAGLIAFLYDVNGILTWLFAAVLFLAITVYSIFTLLPLISLSSPYATPLSPILWRIWQISKVFRGLILDNLRRMSFSVTGLLHSTSTFRAASSSPTLPDPEAQLITDTHRPLANQKRVQKGQSLVVATMKASRIKRHQHEAASVTWTLRSLNDDAEILPFLEALPDALQNGDALRESNLHLVGPLLETTDPSADVISRTFSLMENAHSPWFGDLHRQRCATACARVFLAISRVLVEHPGRFTRPKPAETHQPHRINWFSREMVDKLERAIYDRWLDQSPAATAAALCMLSACQSTREDLSTYDKRFIPASLLESLLVAAGFSYLQLAKCLGLEHSMPPNFVDHSQAHEFIDFVTSELLRHYLRNAMTHYPSDFERVCGLFASNGGNLYKSRYGGMPFDSLCEKLDSSPDSGGFKSDYDTIFGVMLMSSSKEEYPSIIRYISKRVRDQGWGDTKKLWQGKGRLLHCLKILQSAPLFLSFDSECSTALQELLLHRDAAQDEYVDFFWAYIQETLHSQKGLNGSTHRSHLSFLIPLTVLIGADDQDPSFNRIVQHSLKEMESDTELYSELESLRHHWAILLYALNAKLSPLQTREVLQLFHTWPPFYCFTPDPELSPHSMTKFVSHTVEFRLMWETDPSIDILDINAMLWSMWASVTRYLGWHESRETLIPWSNLLPLLDLSNKLLTPESRNTVEKIISESSERQRHTIGDQDCCSDFIKNVQSVHKQMSDNLPMFIDLPPPEGDEML